MLAGGGKNTPGLRRAESHPFTKNIHGLGQMFPGGGGQNMVDDLGNIIIAVAVIFRRQGMGGQQGGADFHRPVAAQLLRHPQLFQLISKRQAIAGFNFNGGHAFAH